MRDVKCVFAEPALCVNTRSAHKISLPHLHKQLNIAQWILFRFDNGSFPSEMWSILAAICNLLFLVGEMQATSQWQSDAAIQGS